MKFTQVVPFLFASLALAAPAPDKTLQKRAATTICGQWDSVVTGTYTVYQDLWNEASATSGSQCTTVDSLTGNTIVWSTSWSWAGGSNQVKSYANVALTTTGVQIKSISSIPTVWHYSYTGTSLVADVSYDIFTSSTSTGSNEYEIMIWLAALGGAGPISSTGSAIATPTINGVKWNLFSGPNGATTVYSFVAQSQVTSFSGDLLLFFTYLESNNAYSSSQYITTLEAGTEPFTGSSAVLSVSAYSVSIATGAVTSSTKTSTTSTKVSASTTKISTTTSSAATSTGGTIPKYYQCGGTGWTGSGTCVAGTTCTYSNAYYSQCL